MLATMANTTSAGKLVGSCDTSWQSWSRCGQATHPQLWVDTVSILQAVCRYCVHTAGSLSDIYQLTRLNSSALCLILAASWTTFI